MPLTVPNLFKTECTNITACGLIRTSDTAILQWLDNEDKKPNRIAKIKVAGRVLYIRLSVGRHFHIDVAKPKFFAEKPEVTTKISDINKLFEKVNGQKIVLRLEGDYLVQTDALPTLILSTMLTAKGQGDVAFRMTGGTISVKGSPIYRIEWARRSDSETRVTLSARTEATITDSYLVDGLSLINTAFRAFIVRREPAHVNG